MPHLPGWAERLADGQHSFYPYLVGLMNQRGLTEIPLTFGSLLGKNVPVIGFFSFELARRSKLEAFFRRAVRFHLWHFTIPQRFIKTNNLKPMASKNKQISTYF